MSSLPGELTQLILCGQKGSELRAQSVRPHQSQQAADLVDSTDAAEESHGHGQGAHSDQDVGSDFHRV